MAGQFDKYVKILGTGSRPDRFKGAPGNPDIVAPIETNAPENTEDNKNRSLPANAPKQAAANAASKKEADASMVRKHYNRNSRKRQIAGLSTTTMRLDEKTGEAYDSSEVIPPKANPVSNLLSKGFVKPNTSAKPADWEEITNPISAEDADRARANYKPKGETPKFDATIKETTSTPKVDTPAPTNQPYNLTTGEVKAEYNDPNSINSTTLTWDPKKGEAVETGVRHTSPQFAKVDVIKARRGGTVHSDKVVRDFETEHPDSDQSSAATGQTRAEANKKSRYTEPLAKPTKRKLVTESARAVVEGDIAGAAYEQIPDPKRPGYSIEGPNVAAGYDDPNDLRSTTMREVPAEGPRKPVRHEKLPGKPLVHVPVRSPRDAAPYEKPTVNRAGNVIPPLAIDTFGAQPTDRKQAEAENKRLRARRGTPVTTTVFDPNVRASRPARGQTPERQIVLAGIRETRAAELAGQKTPEGKPKKMTTVAPEVMATAKGLGKTERYNLDEDYMNSTAFLSHPAVQKATVAHALGVHHTLADPDEGHLGRYLGGRPLEAASRLAAAYKIVDRNRRGNPEKIAGEFALLRGMVQAGSSPQKTFREVKNDSSEVLVNGQNVALAAGSSENRNVIADKATKITAQTESAPKIARGSVAATPTAPLAGSNRVAVRRVGQAPEEAVVREFSPQEARNRKNVPGPDDSKRPRVIDLQGLRPGETSPNKVLKEEKDS
jgi:hypothetical protein